MCRACAQVRCFCTLVPAGQAALGLRPVLTACQLPSCLWLCSLTQVLLYPRPGKAPAQAKPKVIPAPAFFSWHHVNAYERNGGTEVVVDTISWQDVAFDVTQYTVKPVSV